MTDFFSKQEYTIEDIQSLIDSGAEESLKLEFKSQFPIEKEKRTKAEEISKDISAFANSDGGIIIYGIKERKHKADSFNFINGNTFTKEWLEQIINSGIQQRISGLEIYPIRNEGKIEETVYLIKIPKSDNAPHRCRDGRFYRRFNFESVIMEEYEIRNLYYSSHNEILEFYIFSRGEVEKNTYDIRINVHNAGRVIVKDYKTVFIFSGDEAWRILPIVNKGNTEIIQTISGLEIHLSMVGTEPIFPDEEVCAFNGRLKFMGLSNNPNLTDFKVSLKVLYGTNPNNYILDEWPMEDFFMRDKMCN